ncbi:helix-turn-helix domain-containing protein [Synechococcus sp. PCC 7336]|uniref:helix-turn-helix domain-containing protein n=1 Tax=Synechococcus sp. PCC 7336 TaxID=195250 RepID=UPI0003692E0B|nr:helix-turn-helix transcriptional regulator [Synechococcus sp. PCC 7336]
MIYLAYLFASIQALISDCKEYTTEAVVLALPMGFAERVLKLRKQKRWTQQELADRVGVRVLQIRRYESGTSKPTLEAIRKLALAFNISADALVFDDDERGPEDELKLQFEAVSQMPEEEKKIIRALLDGMIIKYQTSQMVKNWSA